MNEWVDWAHQPTKAGSMSRWKQPQLVLSYCRMLHTLDSGRVASKREGAKWALGALAREWAGLIQQALDDRPDPWVRVYQCADPEVIDRTIAFIGYAVSEAAAR